MSINRWHVCISDEKKIEEYMQKFDVSKLVASVLCSREFDSDEEIVEFLNGSNFVEDPFSFTDMDKMVVRIWQAFQRQEKICVYGDYDADGITACALMYKYFKSKNINVVCYVPERDRDGYGLNKNAIDFIKSQGVNLIFTVDSGITAVEEVAYAQKLGMDVVITDHHRVHETIPGATAIVNPCRAECENLKHKNFAGVGVAFKVIQALEKGKTDYNQLLDQYSDLVTIGTIGDSIPLYGETREIVKYGIKNIEKSPNVALKALLNVSNLNGREVSASSVAFGLVPRINACGRMNNASLALKALLSNNSEEALSLCSKLNNLNDLRKEIEARIFESVEALLKNEPWRKYEEIIVAEGENWDHGVIGIVASRIAAKYGKPCILITIEGETARGSCRSVEGFSIYDVLKKCSEYLTRFGGHHQAAGFSLYTCDIEKLKESVKTIARQSHILCPSLNIGAILTPDMISSELLKDLDILKPFGSGNPEPIFGFFNLKLIKIQPLSQNKHLKLVFSYGRQTIEALYFNKPKYDFLYREGEFLDIAVSLNKNEYRGIVSISLYVIDLKLSRVNLESVLESKVLYERFKRGLNLTNEQFSEMLPTRDEFVAIYKYLRLTNGCLTRADLINFRLFDGENSLLKINMVLEILEELKLITIFRNGDEYRINLKNIKEKVDLEKSEILNCIRIKKGEVLSAR